MAEGNTQAHATEQIAHEEHKSESHTTEITKDNVFPHLLSGLGDHPNFYWLNYKITELPKIFIDDGFHFYPSTKSMLEAGVYTEVHHHPVRVDNGAKPGLDLSVTNLVVFQWIAMLIVLVIFGIVGRKYKKNPKREPKGLQNAMEAMVLFVRDDVVKPNIPSERAVRNLFPYFVGLFFFILPMNLLGLMPGGHTATGALAVTGALAITAFFVINITAMREAGVGAWFKHLLGGAPWWLFPIMVPIEIISMFVKPFALTIRLFANMTAGHVVLFSLVGLIFFFNLANGPIAGAAIVPVSVAFSIFMYLLELLVAMLQAYIFTILTAVFVGLAIGDHAHENEHAAEH